MKPWVGFLIVACLFSPTWAFAKPTADDFLTTGRLREGATELKAYLAEHPDDDQAKYSLGLVQFVTAIEHLGQSLYRYGLRNNEGAGLAMNIPILRFPVPQNQFPEKLSYEAWRQVFATMIEDLATAERTLAQVDDPQVKSLVHVGQMQLRFNDTRTGQITISEVLRRLRLVSPALNDDFIVVFDRADVSWLRGYCHLLMALGEMYLAHDSRECFAATAHLFFRRPETPYPFLQAGRKVFSFSNWDIADVIAFIHLIHFPVEEPKRMAAAHEHLQSVLGMSREMWKFAQSEEDDEHEWIPNARQHGALNIPVTQQMIDAWLAFVDEAEALLDGKRLVPFWRGEDRRGINLRRVFLEPQAFDLVLWVQGTGAAPYLEDGELTRTSIWNTMNQVFQGRLFGFAAWFN